jgi:hypothetical protein
MAKGFDKGADRCNMNTEAQGTSQESTMRIQTDTTTKTKDMTEVREHEGRKFVAFTDEYMGTLISTHFSTGQKVHAAHIGSSVALCGGWMGYASTAYRQYTQPDCKRCIKVLDRMTEIQEGN